MEIVAKFLDENSEHYINIDEQDKQRLYFGVAGSTPLDERLFVSAQEHIWGMLNFDTLPKYLASDNYKKST